ncbi:MAG: cytochrome C oxidase subunit IV family protein [Anaerolineaceae bacterium]|nr:cytochrome C oxidase subunit IV family protein [Anaerolineaceae bacterium]
MMKLSALKKGVIVFLILAVLTAIEYYLGINEVPSILLWAVALIKMLLVLQFFMHINRVINPDKGGHE